MDKWMHACIICLAVLSSLLNLMREAPSVMAFEATFAADSAEFPAVVMVLLRNGGPAAVHKDQLNIELASVTEQIFVCKKNFKVISFKKLF